MKKILIITTALMIITYSNTRAQVKLFSNGSFSIGSLIQPQSGTELQVIGNTRLAGSAVDSINDTITPTYTVRYNGQDRYYVLGNGQAYAYGWNTISDSTLKENVRPIANALDKVTQLQGVTYNLKATETADKNGTHATGSRKMGLIAQSVERVTPEVVTITPDGIKTVAYGNMVGLLIEALKEEDAKVNLLQHRLDSCIANNRLKNN